MKRIVLDTNTIISGYFWKGNPRKILNLVKAGKYTLLSSKAIEEEFIRVLGYPKIGLSPGEILPIIQDHKFYARIVDIKSSIDVIKADPTDNIFLACAQDGQAHFIISGDHHLLDLKFFQNIPIVSAKDFLVIENIT